MTALSKYLTIQKESEGIYKEKGSKFIGIATPCYNEEEAKVFLEKWSNAHHQARHLCYAYRFGVDKEKYRANDDGEPNNSAGQPILGQIDSFELTNVLIGVVRYYGGTKLGVGGLINAYRTAAKDAIENGKIIELEVYQWLIVTFNYVEMPHILNYLKKIGIEPMEKQFDNDCQIKIKIELNMSEEVQGTLLNYSSVELDDLGVY